LSKMGQSHDVKKREKKGRYAEKTRGSTGGRAYLKKEKNFSIIRSKRRGGTHSAGKGEVKKKSRSIKKKRFLWDNGEQKGGGQSFKFILHSVAGLGITGEDGNAGRG